MNDTLTTDSLELHNIYSEISLIHNIYNFKKFEPPEELSLKNLVHNYEYFKSETIDFLDKSISEIQCDYDINEKISVFRNLCEINEGDKELNKLYVNLDGKRYKCLQNAIKNHLKFLEIVNKELKHNDNILDKAIMIFDRHFKEK
ncbi:hypothetical protein NAPIS_ORF00782 [Vairimorpha apis BRL 01]|uniref:Uncharacterized protein n=1 Tax=Vairimorpha apis BRL 01 TaxID=1037528 RepID=T0LBB0_9MICR|nr:hypothetical protein NAPIS_ORF00782 [Vairimorpha apis BRL 01]